MDSFITSKMDTNHMDRKKANQSYHLGVGIFVYKISDVFIDIGLC